jgi:hypothetical protein
MASILNDINLLALIHKCMVNFHFLIVCSKSIYRLYKILVVAFPKLKSKYWIFVSQGTKKHSPCAARWWRSNSDRCKSRHFSDTAPADPGLPDSGAPMTPATANRPEPETRRRRIASPQGGRSHSAAADMWKASATPDSGQPSAEQPPTTAAEKRASLRAYYRRPLVDRCLAPRAGVVADRATTEDIWRWWEEQQQGPLLLHLWHNDC